MEEHTSLKRVKFTQPVKFVKLSVPFTAPWMKYLGIVALQRERDQLRYEAHLHKTEESSNS